MTRFVLAAILLASGLAHADGGTLPNGIVLQYNRLFTHQDNNPDHVQPNLNTEDEWHYFNYAHCQCAKEKGRDDPDFHESTYAYEVIPSNAGTAAFHHPLQFWVGAGCSTDQTTRNTNCRHLAYADIADIGNIQSQHTVTPEVSLYDLMTPVPGTTQCPQQVLSATQWLLTDTALDGTLDYSLSVSINTDTLAPPLPPRFNISGAENAISIKWDAPDGSTGDPTDIEYFQAMCATMDGQPAVDPQYAPSPHYITPNSLCGSDTKLDIVQSSDSDTLGTSIDGGTASLTHQPLVDPDAGVDAMVDAGVAVDASPFDAPPDSIGQPPNIPEGFASYDPTFLCGEADSKTATSMRIDHLQNGTPYQVMFLAIDKYGNVRGTTFADVFTPQPVTDFWEDLHDQGSKVEGGFCLLAETYGDDNWPTTRLRAFRDQTLAHSALGRWLIDVYYGTLGSLGPYVHGSLALRIVSGILLAPLVALALAWHYLTLLGMLALLALPLLYRHRRKLLRSRAASAATVVALICLAGGRSAHADGFQPYWEHDSSGETSTEADEPQLVKWVAGVRVGPYTPSIDKQLGKDVYSEMFGTGVSILPMIDLERVIWHGSGMVSVGGTIGYLSKDAYAYKDMTTPGDPNRPRSSGDKTSFNLIPLALTASYRASQLDDDYGIPVVPFVRVGLAYYIWWIRAPSGDYAQVCSDGGTEPDCSQNTARGASLGVTGEIGVTIHAERIDSDAAKSMRESGLMHAGLFAEFQLSKVDGFGSDKKLSVGDNTWFAGVNFEF